ncbi:hypothetical protein ACF1G0_18190 [Streptomyces sp. NPDC013953]|uniref:hypothetical protein n=1 Tax=Streptomyces sp. NPDC013953 TaxID=3364868 RepID=UPI0036F6E065
MDGPIRTTDSGRKMELDSAPRRRTAALVGSVLLAMTLPFALTACGSDPSPGAQRPAPQRPAAVRLAFDSTPVIAALAGQAGAAQQAVARTAADEGRGVCTTDPADRAACRNPDGHIHPDGGDVDGDGVFEDHEPVGPGYRDPRAYDGGRTSGETQCDWLRSQGIAC